MKYENAKDVLPNDLFSELQKYAAGKLLYVPSPCARRPWGIGTGYRRQLDERNDEIRTKFAGGASIDSLADAYFLTPETVKKIVYRKKENVPMEIKEILQLYTNEKPVKIETGTEKPAYRSTDTDAPTGLFLELLVEYPDRKMTVSVCDYVFATPERVKQSASAIEALRREGYACPRILNTLRGEPCAKVGFKDRVCTVFAQEYVEETDLFAAATGDGFPPLFDDILFAAAKTASLRLAGEEPSAYALFEPVTACAGFEDYVAEYVYGDLKNEILGRYPALAERYERIAYLFSENRRTLCRAWGRLPTSLFHGNFSGAAYVDADGRFGGFRGVSEGGRETCIQHFVRLAFFLSSLGVENGCDEVFDAEQRERRLRAFRHCFKVFAEHYAFTDDEIKIAPLVYRDLLFGAYYYWSVTDFAHGDETRLAAFFDYLEKQLQTDEIGFASILNP